MSRSRISQDRECPALFIREYDSGRVTYTAVIRHAGRRRWIVLGDFEKLTLGEARTLALRAEKDIRDGREKVGPITFEELSLRWCAARSDLKTLKHYERALRNHILPRLGRYQSDELTTWMLQELHSNWSRTGPYEANRRMDLISSILSFGMKLGVNEQNFAKSVSRNREKPRRTYIPAALFRDFVSSVELEKHESTKVALLLMAYTGCRPSEILSLRWECMHESERGWSFEIPETKNGRAHSIPVPAHLASRLEKGKKLTGWVFPAAHGNGHLRRIENAWSRVRIRLGIDDLQLRDLRRTFATLSLQDGVSLARISDALNHSSINITRKVYAHLETDNRRSVVDAFAERRK